MNNLVEEFKNRLKNMSNDEIDELRKRCEIYKGVKPTVDEYIRYIKKHK